MEVIKRFLRLALASPQEHQQRDFSCGTRCCVAGSVVIYHFPELAQYLPDYKMCRNALPNDPGISCEARAAWDAPIAWISSRYRLSDGLSYLLFNGNVNVYCHRLGLFLLDHPSVKLEIGLFSRFEYASKCWPFSYLYIQDVKYKEQAIEELLFALGENL
jgi:hypothetical protein